MRSKFICLLALVGSCLITNAQINVGDAEIPNPINKSGSVDKDDLEAFKATTTICFLQNKDKAKIPDYQKAASQVWTFNKIEFTTISEYDKYVGKPGYSFITTTGEVFDRGNASSSSRFYLKFWYPHEKRNGKINEKVIAQVALYLDPGTVGQIMYGRDKKTEKSDLMVSDEATYYNLSPGFMKCYLGVIDKCLNEKKKHWYFDQGKDKTLMPNLATDTLFIPDYVLYGNGMKAGKQRDEKELLSEYSYKYRLLTTEAIDKKILNAQKKTFVFIYIYFSSQKFYTIYEAQTGSLVFWEYESMSMNGLNDGDFKKIAKRID